MADVTLAEANGHVWLVGGDEHIDGLLGNTLAPTVTVEIVTCANRAEAWALWEANSTEATDGAMPWVIHPGIVRRIKGALGGDQSIHFTPWSAMLAEEAQAVIATAAAWLQANPAGRVTLRQFSPVDASAGVADLQRLRGQLVIGALARAGANADRVTQETRPSQDAIEAERLDLVTGMPATITAD